MNHRFAFAGTTKAPSSCADLELTFQTGVGKDGFDDDSIHVTVDRVPGTDCSDCPAEISYAAATEFDTDPSKIHVYHIEKVDDAWKRIGPLTTKTVP